MLLDETGRRKELEFDGGCVLQPVFRIAFAFEDRRTHGEKLWKNRDLKKRTAQRRNAEIAPDAFTSVKPTPDGEEN